MRGLNRNKRLGLVFGSIEVMSIYAASFFPNNQVRIAVMRLWGAKIGSGCAIHHGLQVRSARKLRIGDDVFVAENVVLDARGGLIIGPHTSINSGSQIWTAQHDISSQDFAFRSKAVWIGRRVWICSRSLVLPGVKIGNGAVVGAGSVVPKDLESWTMNAGSPARKIKERERVDAYLLNASRNKVWWW